MPNHFIIDINDTIIVNTVTMQLDLSIIDYTSPLYSNVLDLRQSVLRAPLGLNLMDEDLDEDRDQYIVVGCNQDEVVACLMLKIVNKDTIKFRQMAVTAEYQQHGFGSMLVHYAENFCLLNEYTQIELHARKYAVPFYLKLDYNLVGEEFEEVGIPHYKMIKSLV